MNRVTKGFTLIELMITLSIAAVVLTLAVPSFAAMMKNRRLTTEINNFSAALSLARSEAVKRRLRVTVCKSSDGEACVEGGDISQGWIIFIDDKATPGTVDDEELVLKVYSALDSSMNFTGVGSGGSNIANFITYAANGTTLDSGNVTLCDDRTGAFGRLIRVNTMGRNRTAVGIACS